MKQPIIKLKFDQKLDRELAWDFYSNPEFGGCNFWKERALKHHLKLIEIKSTKNPKEFLNKYVTDFYKSNDKEIKTLSESTVKYLNQEQDKFFLIIDELFKGHPWSKKKFIGYFSIFDFCPRFLDSGEFQVFIYDNRNLQLFTIFHEMLHFMFYDFAQKNFPEMLGKMDTEQGKFWDIAEVFNAVIQNTDDFISLHGKIKDIGYPEHKELILQGSRLWKKNPIDDNLNMYFKDFFIRGTIAIDCLIRHTAFMGFGIGFLFVDDNPKKYKKGLKKFPLKNDDPRFVSLVNVIKHNKTNWYSQFREIRRKIEHDGFALPNLHYHLNKKGKIEIIFPAFDKQSIEEVLEIYWESLTNLCEEILVFLLSLKLKDDMIIVKISDNMKDKDFSIKYAVRHKDFPQVNFSC